MKRSTAHGLVAALLSTASMACVTDALVIGGADGLAVHRRAASERAPVYDCHEHWIGRGSTCRPRTVPRAETPAPRRTRVATLPTPVGVASSGKLQVRVPYAGGQLAVLGLPTKYPGQVALILRPVTRLAAAPCGDVRLTRDGDAVAVGEVVRAGDHELRLTLPLESLRGLEHSTRMAGWGCGHAFVLDELGRRTLSHFEVRFREELGRTQAVAPQVSSR